jgi:uncharacterized protein YcaQ
MTAGRVKGQHLYDLTERVVPAKLLAAPDLSDEESKLELALERYRALGVMRPNAPPEVWSYSAMMYDKKWLVDRLAKEEKIVPLRVEGQLLHSTPEFLNVFDLPALDKVVRFIAPLDQIMWDRKFVQMLFGFDYIWEIYKKVEQRKWGYYVLPVMYGDLFVARVEFQARGSSLEVREWHFESADLELDFWEELEKATLRLMRYAGVRKVAPSEHLPKQVRTFFKRIKLNPETTKVDLEGQLRSSRIWVTIGGLLTTVHRSEGERMPSSKRSVSIASLFTRRPSLF